MLSPHSPRGGHPGRPDTTPGQADEPFTLFTGEPLHNYRRPDGASPEAAPAGHAGPVPANPSDRFGAADHRQVLTLLQSIASSLQRIADKVDPPPAQVVGTPYVAKLLGQTTTWVAEMVRTGTLPKGCVVPGTGNGKPWKFYRAEIEAWLKTR